MSYTNNNRYNTTNGGRPQPTKTNVDLSCFTVGLRVSGKLRPEIFLTEAKHIAEAIGKSGETRSQLRAFFAECKGIEYKMSNQTEFEHHASDIWMLKAKVAYKYRNGARDRKLQNVLHDLISQGVEYVYKENTYESFKDFMKLFEAVVGYSYNEDIKE